MLIAYGRDRRDVVHQGDVKRQGEAKTARPALRRAAPFALGARSAAVTALA
jgi:hypothetical protein